MNSELIAGIDYLEREKGISREKLMEAISDALLTASKKSVGPARELRIEIDPKSGKIRAMAKLIVVEKVINVHDQILLVRARKIKPDVQVGDELDVEVTPENFGRIAAQTAKQAMTQRFRQAEKEMLYEEFKDRAGEIVTGTVKRFERSDVIVDLGKYEAIMPSRERVVTEEYNIGDRVRAYVLAVENGARGPEIILSRSHPNFVRRLFENEVTEIADRTVEIRSVAREAGHRTKIAVCSSDSKVDPVGACVGLRGARVKNVVRELNNEKVDILRWIEDPKEFVAEALKPARLRTVKVDYIGKKIHITVDEDQLSLAIGKRGQNARLTSRLCGMDVLIRREENPAQSFEQRVSEAVGALTRQLGLDAATAATLVKSGMGDIGTLMDADPQDISEMLGIEIDVARSIQEKARKSAGG